MDKKIYSKLLESTIIPAWLAPEEQEKIMNPLSEYVKSIMPKELFRFRECSELSFDALYHDQMWVSMSKFMNDDYDARIYYDNHKIEQNLNELYTDQGMLKMLENNDTLESAEEVFKNVLPNMATALSAFKQLSGTDRKDMSVKFKEYIKNCSLSILDFVPEVVQGISKFACFSESIKSAMMWGHYAKNSTGFAVAYDFTTGLEDQEQESYEKKKSNNLPHYCSLFPMVYENKRYDATDYVFYMLKYALVANAAQANRYMLPQQFLNAAVPCPDTFMGTKIALHKSTEWRPEREWRLFCSSFDPEFNKENHSFVVKRPIAVYLGRKISSINEKIIKDIAWEKGLPVYKMQMKEQSGKYGLHAIRQRS